MDFLQVITEALMDFVQVIREALIDFLQLEGVKPA